MNKQRLRIVIAAYLALLLFAAVILIDFVLVDTEQKRVIKTHAILHQIMADTVRHSLSYKHSPSGKLPVSDQKDLAGLFHSTDISSAGIMDANGRFIYQTGGFTAPMRREMAQLGQRAVDRKSTQHCLRGTTWGVFWQRPRYLMLATPIKTPGISSPITFANVVDLGNIYADQRRIQRVILTYAAINIFLLTLLGTLAISRLIIRPINRLVKRAEEYRDDSDFGGFYANEKNEFRQLSSSLNQMMTRISEDKKRLKSSLEELKQANLEITSQQHELIRAEKLASVGRLAAGIAHEIGNPIGIVLGYLDILNQSSLSEEEKKDYIRRCETEIQRIHIIIRELLDFSRPTIKEIQIVAVHNIIRETFQMLGVQPIMKNIEVILNLDAATDIVSADPDRLRQIFVNLAINAADAIVALFENTAENDFKNPVQGKIEVQSTLRKNANDPTTDWLEISITDNGSGIADKNMDNIFDPFYTTKEPGKGTGLGLSVCFMIIEDLNGTINAHTREGRGTTMTITLPVATDNSI